MSAHVVGLDLSITATGLANDLAAETLAPPKTSHPDRRLCWLRDEVQDRTPYGTRLVVIEGPVVRSSAAVIIGMVHGAIRADLIDRRVPYAVVPPATLKKYATGKGNADKTAMALALYKRAGIELADDNQVDAWWLWAAGLQHLGEPIVDVPAAQLAALEVVDWPSLAPKAAG